MDRPTDKEKSLGTGPMIFLLGGMMIGAAVTRVVVARWQSLEKGNAERYTALAERLG